MQIFTAPFHTLLLSFSFHAVYFHFTAFLSPQKKVEGTSEGNSENRPLHENANVNNSAESTCCCCDHLIKWCGCPEGEGGPKWRGDNEELTGLLDCSMSLRSHIFSRRSRSFSSCSLVLRSLSSFLSLSSVASISNLHHTAGENC